MTTETFTWLPVKGSTMTEKPTVLVTTFGGYEARSSIGINTSKQVWSVKFDVNRATGVQMLNFLRARGALESFFWTTPDGEAGVYVCRSWSRVANEATMAITASFEQVFGE